MKLKYLVLSTAIALGSIIGVGIIQNQPVSAFSAQDCPAGSLTQTKGTGYNTAPTNLAECNMPAENANDQLMPRVNNIINVVVAVLGVVTVGMIVIGAITYITSQGDAAKTTRAKNTIIFGIVGLIIALLAFAIVNFVLKSIF